VTATIMGHAFQLDRPWDGGLDVLITDPPFSKHVHESATSQSAGGGTRERDLGFSYLDPATRRALARTVAGVSRWSVVYSDVESSTWLRLACETAGAEYVRTVPWIRWSMPQLSGDRPPQGFEHTLWFHAQQIGKRGGRKPIAKSWNGPGNLTHLAHLCLRDDHKHKCEKPLDQALDLVSFVTDPGDVVGDLFAGSGVFGLACTILGREFWGWERDPAWAERARALVGGALQKRHADRLTRWIEMRSEEVKATLAGNFTENAKDAARRRSEDVDRARAFARGLGL
jgi:hypothetical protein